MEEESWLKSGCFPGNFYYFYCVPHLKFDCVVLSGYPEGLRVLNYKQSVLRHRPSKSLFMILTFLGK
jgi:hypothetical protein